MIFICIVKGVSTNWILSINVWFFLIVLLLLFQFSAVNTEGHEIMTVTNYY